MSIFGRRNSVVTYPIWGLRREKTYEENIVETVKVQYVKIFGEAYELNINYKNVKTSELNLDNAKIQIILPKKYKKIGNEKIIKAIIDKMYEQIAIEEIDNIMEKVRIKLGMAPEDYEITRMKNTLGKCQEGKITINPDIVKYNKKIIEYVITHEFCHLKYKTHGKRFYEIIKSYIPNYEIFEKKIQCYQY